MGSLLCCLSFSIYLFQFAYMYAWNSDIFVYCRAHTTLLLMASASSIAAAHPSNEVCLMHRGCMLFWCMFTTSFVWKSSHYEFINFFCMVFCIVFKWMDFVFGTCVQFYHAPLHQFSTTDLLIERFITGAPLASVPVENLSIIWEFYHKADTKCPAMLLFLFWFAWKRCMILLFVCKAHKECILKVLLKHVCHPELEIEKNACTFSQVHIQEQSRMIQQYIDETTLTRRVFLTVVEFSVGEFTRYFGFKGLRADAIEDHIFWFSRSAGRCN